MCSEWYARGVETGNPKVPGGYRWWLQCNECGFHLEPGVAAYPRCPECGAALHIHSNAAPYTIIWPIGCAPGYNADWIWRAPG